MSVCILYMCVSIRGHIPRYEKEGRKKKEKQKEEK